jgi:hypothetical protein
MVARVLAAGRITYGIILLARPDVPARIFTGPVTDGWTIAARLLGVRHVAQGAITLASPTRGVVAGGALVDVLHMTTDLLLPLSETTRRAARNDAAVAGSLAILGLLTSTIQS